MLRAGCLYDKLLEICGRNLKDEVTGVVLAHIKVLRFWNSLGYLVTSNYSSQEFYITHMLYGYDEMDL